MAPRKVAPRRSLLRGGKVIVPGAPGSPCERSRQGARRSQAEARNKGRKVHFASLTDICHLRNSELDPRNHKYQGRGVLRCDIVEDVSGSYAVFTEQGSSASQISRLPGCSGQAADAVYVDIWSEWKMHQRYSQIRQSECPDFWICLPKHKRAKIMLQYERPVVPLERDLYGYPLAGLLWKRQFEKVLSEHGWEKVLNRECLLVNRARGLFPSMYVDDIKLAGKNRLGNFSCKTLVWENQHHFLTMDIWAALKETAK